MRQQKEGAMDEDGEQSVGGSVNTKTTQVGGGVLYNEDYILYIALYLTNSYVF